MKRALARLVDAAFNRYAPIVHQRTLHAFTTDMVGAEQLATVEEHFDSLPPWQHHDDSQPDDLWAAMQRHPVGKRRGVTKHALKVVPNQPVDAGGALPGVDGSHSPAGAEAMTADFPPSAAASASGAGGFPTEADLKVVVSRVLRDCGSRYPSTTTDVLVRELLLHFTFHHK